MLTLFSFIRVFTQDVRLVLGRQAGKALMAFFCNALALSGVEILAALASKWLLGMFSSSNGEPNEITTAHVMDFCLFLLLLGIVRGGAMFLNYQLGRYSVEIVGARLRLLLSYHLLHTQHLGTLRPSEANTLFNETMHKITAFMRGFSDGTVNAIASFVILIGLFCLAWRETAVVTLLAAILGVSYTLFVRRIKKHFVSLPLFYQQLARAFGRVNRNWIMIRVFHYQKKEFGNVRDNIVTSSNKILGVYGIMGGIAIATPVLGIAAISITLFLSLTYFHSSSQTVFPFLYLFVRFTIYCSSAYLSVGAVLTEFAAFKQVAKFIRGLNVDERTNATKSLSAVRFLGSLSQHTTPPPFFELTTVEVPKNKQIPEIQLKDVCFSYQGDEAHPMIENLSLTIAPGEHLGITGKSGSGKSTLLLLILGILQPRSGTITLGGETPTNYLQNNAGRIAYLGAELMLFEGTLRENLLYGSRYPVDDSVLLEALKSVGLEHTVLRSSLGLDSVLSEVGLSLSVGEKQRLGFARAIVMDPLLLVLDEPTANLDAETEKSIADLISGMQLKCTVVTVTHRPILNKENTQILNLENTYNERIRSRVA